MWRLLILIMCFSSWSFALESERYIDLYFVDTIGIGGLDLSTGETIRLLEKRGQPEGLTTINDSEVLFSVHEKSSEYATMYYFNTRNDEVVRIGPGSNPVYLQSRNELVFFDKSPSGYGLSLYSATIDGGKRLVEKSVLFYGPFTSGTAPLVISERTILVIDSSNTPWLLDLEAEEKVVLSEYSSCLPRITVGQEVLCSVSLHDYRMFALGSSCRSVDISFPGFPILHVPDSNSILFLRESGEIGYELYVFDVLNGEISIVKTDAVFSRGDASLSASRILQ